MFVGLRKSSLEDELNDLMVELSAAVCEDIRGWGDTEPLHICICKVVWELRSPGVRWAQALDVSTLPLEDMLDGMLRTPMA